MTREIISNPEHVSRWFELSYARYLTVPRSVLEAMPDEWQKKFYDLFIELDARIDWRPEEGRYYCFLRDAKGHFLHDKFAEYRRPIRIEVRPYEPSNS